MAAIGITQGQLGITTTKYDHLCELNIPEAKGLRITHVVANSTMFPTKELGHLPSMLSGKFNKLSGTEVMTLMGVIRTGTSERRITFMLGGDEMYVYSYSGDVSSPVCVNSSGLPTAADRQYGLSFSFPLSRSGVYLASSDAVQWGS